MTANTSNAKRPPGWRRDRADWSPLATSARSPPAGAMQRPRIASPTCLDAAWSQADRLKAVLASPPGDACEARVTGTGRALGPPRPDAAPALNPAGTGVRGGRPAATRGGGWRGSPFAGCVAACAIGGFALLHSAPVEQRIYRSAAGTLGRPARRTVRATLNGDSGERGPARTRHRPPQRGEAFFAVAGTLEPAIRGTRRRPQKWPPDPAPFRGAPRQRRDCAWS